jgi:hypothetical protein
MVIGANGGRRPRRSLRRCGGLRPHPRLADAHRLRRRTPRQDGQAEFARIDRGDHPLPGVVLATVCGHRAGSASYLLDAAALLRAIDLLTPAEACAAYEPRTSWRGGSCTGGSMRTTR